MYSSNTDNQGNVELHLRDSNDINEKAFTSVFGKLESDQDSYTISYQDDTGTVLHQNNIDILLGAAALQSNGKLNKTPTRHIFSSIIYKLKRNEGEKN